MRVKLVFVLAPFLVVSSASAGPVLVLPSEQGVLWPATGAELCQAAEHTRPSSSSADSTPSLAQYEKAPRNASSTYTGALVSWDFDDTGTVAAAEGPWAVHAELSDDCGRGPGVSGLALELDGSGAYGTLPTDTGIMDNLASLESGSISMWFRFDEVPPYTEIHPLFYVGSGVGGVESSYIELEIGHFSSNSYLYFTVLSGYSFEGGKYFHQIPLCIRSQQELEPQRWYHVAVTVSETGNHFYLDGVELNPPHYPFGNETTQSFYADVWAPSVAWFGRGILGSIEHEQYLDGGIDDVQLHDRILSSDEIAAYVASTKQAAHVTFDSDIPATCVGSLSLSGTANAVSQLGYQVDAGPLTEISAELSWVIAPTLGPGHHTVEVHMLDHFGQTHSDAIDMANVDLNSDLTLGIDDLLLLIGAWGESDAQHDLTGDLSVDIADLLLMLEAWPL